MKEDRFNKMMEGVMQGAEYLKGVSAPANVEIVTVQVPDVKLIRERQGLSQSEFALMLGISVRTLQNWEQGHRLPGGPARVLLEVAAAYPEHVRTVSQRLLNKDSRLIVAAAG